MGTAENKQRKAGSEQFKINIKKANQPLGMSSNPFTAANREKTQQRYGAYEERGYDNLSNLETYKARSQNNRLKEGGRYDYRDAAKAGMQSNKFDFGGDLSGYDSAAAGTKQFDRSDVKYLKKSGASDEAINKYISGLDNVHDSLRTSSQYGGTHYRGDMDKTKGIEQFDMGKGFNIWDIKYLQNQGYDDKAIADYGINSGLNHGSASAKYLDSLGRLDTRAKSTFGNTLSQLENTPINVPYQNTTPDLKEQQDRVDEEMNKDYWGQQEKREDRLIANSPNQHDSEKFLKKHIGMARGLANTRTGLDLSSKYNSGFNLDINALDKQIRKAPLYWGARSEVQGDKIFGDRYRNSRENSMNWKQPDPPKAFVPPNFASIYDKTKKDIDNI